ncbi:MAG: epoxyqueuosine reductase QueH [Lachnospiraceae bacterium]|nr:epoxyqueuosine reductase QueH [Lachnospiraceae bacterium]
MNKRDYQKELDGIIKENGISGTRPSLLLHVCCAPCSSYCMEYLTEHFDITLLFYNPNMDSSDEYEKRKGELLRLVKEASFPVKVKTLSFEPEEFLCAVKGLEDVPEGGSRCFVCYELRLRRTAQLAAENGFDYFTTTLSISPLKNAEKINEIGERLGKEYGVKHLPSDFKKRNGYKRSIELSREYDLYRQDYCGCVYSKKEREKRRTDN